MEGGAEGSSSSAAAGVVPESAMEAVKQTLAQLQELKPQLEQMMSLAKPEVLSQMQPLQRAKTMYLFAEATTTIFALRLRCTGVNPDDHRVKSEIERLNVYREKLQRCTDRSKVQKQNIRDLSKGVESSMTYSETTAKKRKFQSNENQSVQPAAKKFLEKAARELNGDNEKGPLMAAADGSDDVERGAV